MVKAAIVIVHYKNEADTRECLKSIFINHASKNLFRVILVINSQSASFSAQIKKEFPQIVTIENDFNAGFAQGNNIGIKKALQESAEHVILLNSDTIVSLGLFDKLVKFAESETKVGLISPKIYFAKGFEFHKDKYEHDEEGRVLWYGGGVIDWNNIYPKHLGVDEVDQGQYDTIEKTDFATGCCMLIPRKTIETVGFFDEKYFLYWEDIDLSERVKKHNLKVIYYPKTFLWHKNASSSGKPGSKIHIYYQNRNRLYFGFKYASFTTKKSLFIDSLRLFARGGVYSKSVADYYFAKMGEASL